MLVDNHKKDSIRLPNPSAAANRLGRPISVPPGRAPAPGPPAGPVPHRAGHPVTAPRPARAAEVAEARRVLGLPLYPVEVIAAVRAMSVARATVGFVEFFLAFELRREHAATWWFGLLLVGSAVGSLLGSMIVPRLRSHLSEREIIAAALVALVAGGLVSGLIGNLWSQVLLTFVVGIAPMSAKPALDSQVQRSVPPALLGRSFGRIETRLQLFWVAASLVGVIIPFPLRLGDGAVAAASLVAVLSYLSGGLGRTDSRIRIFRPGERPAREVGPASS